MANSNLEYDSFIRIIRHQFRSLDTIKPGRVIALNGNQLTAQILTKTKFADGKQVEFPDVVDVVYFTLNAQRGNAFINLPIQVGDLCTVFFSDRDLGELVTSDGSEPVDADNVFTHRYEPLWAIPGWLLPAEAHEVDRTNIVVQNRSTRLTITPDGSATLVGDYTVEGNATITGNLDVSGNTSVGGNANITGTSTAAEHTSGSVSLTTHVHPGVTSGGSNTGPGVG